MVKLEWGTKRTCQNCLSRFYDLQKTPINCPKCGTQFEIHTPGRRTRSRAGADESKVVSFENDVMLDNDLDIDTDMDGDLDDDTLIEDTSDLDEGIDDMADMIDVDEKEDH